ncbi:MAG: LacI family transcriptional regulator [Streptococcaceae bacterium]|jgi:DNA-binding LacI/PurR family transcriptional regulator|nr:LacI family transcriptional regulator [Streptococcaceae bacterium]
MVVPLYQKISDDLKAQITTQKLKAGDKLPTELELSETYNVSRITAKHALSALEQLGMITRSRGKGSFVSQELIDQSVPATKSILFIQPFGDLSFGDFAQGLISEMKPLGYTVFITHAEFLNEATASEIMQNFNGLIYYPMNTDAYLDILFEMVTLDFPVILLDKEIYGLPFPCVKSDNFMGGLMATQHLINEGHERIAFMMNQDAHPPHTTRDRYLGYMQALNKANLSFHTHYNNPDESSLVVLDYLKKSKLTAMVCENDLIALSLMTTLQQAGISVPGEVSIIGFDNIQAASLSNPPLTTIEQSFSALGEEAARLLLDWIQTSEVPTSNNITVQLIKRKTTKEIKHEH